MPNHRKRLRPRRSRFLISAPVMAPEARPDDGPAGANNRAGKVANLRRSTPASRSRSASRPVTQTTHRSGSNEHVTVGCRPARPAEESDKTVAGFHPAHGWAWLVRPAASVDLARGDAGDPKLWPLGAKDGAIAVPHCCRRTLKRLSRGNDGGCGWRFTRRQEIPADQDERELCQEAHLSSPMGLAGDTIVVAVEVSGIARLATEDGSNTRSPRFSTVPEHQVLLCCQTCSRLLAATTLVRWRPGTAAARLLSVGVGMNR